MARYMKCDFIDDLQGEKETWHIIAKVVRKWYGQNFGGSKIPFTLDMVLMDSKVFVFFCLS